MLNDSQQRAKATDPIQSYIVQAPAGSGKTEILTQRYLRLLSTVTAPEQIIALTFTRKAANEMRERILRAMHHVARGDQATSPHQQTTYDFAAAALAQDKALEWQLLQQPHRLRVITIDSLCQTLTHAIPLQDKQIHYAHISDKPHEHYLQAAKACLDFAITHETYHSAIKTLLIHVDNRQDHLLTLFISLLSKRDQWLSSLYQAQSQDKAQYEQGIQWIEEHELERFRQTIPKHCAQELTRLAQQVACIEGNMDSPRYPLCDWSAFDALDGTLANSLCALVLTSQNTLRKAFDHHVGLKKGACSDQEYTELKTASKLLLTELAELPDFLDALLRIKHLPTPHYDQEQWQVLQALFTLLPVLAAHLNMVFSEHNEVDFSAISQQALQALGHDENPTDLALYLDNRIHHILVDEFQDTSIQQFHLLEKLVHGWEPNDGKTLFVVGDPMQSIYRFRSAEVGLFLRAREHGIGAVHLTPLELTCNFRSTETIVDWVNVQFKTIFPNTNDIEFGAVSFHASVSVKPANAQSFIKAFQYETRIQEARAIVELVQDELLAYPDDNIALLVRSRSQLVDIVRLLREHAIPFQGVEIDQLSNLPHLQDVWSLTQALLMPAHRLSWLALLRSPWCGLSLADLHCIANYSKSKSIFFALSELDKITDLTANGRLRAQFVYTILHSALTQRHQQLLVDWIMSTLEQLQLKSILTPAQQEDLEQYWLLLERFEKDGQLSDIELFKNELNKLYSQKVTPSRLQIMTIHKSKGLEFDCVILPGLSSKASNKDMPLLRWLKIPTQQQRELLLLSPMKAAHHQQCLLYNYLGKLDSQKDDYELQRLFYVAVTRAKKRLYLFDGKSKIIQGSFRSLLVNQNFLKTDNELMQTESINSYPDLYHLPIAFYQQIPERISESKSASVAITPNTTPRLMGIVAHELLQWICDNHPQTIAEVPWALATYSFKTMGFHPDESSKALAVLQEQLTCLFTDPIGKWIIKKHVSEKNEYALLVPDEGEVATRIIDRTFCENGVRWVIDFKTGREDHKMQLKHRQQVNEYAKRLLTRFHEPVHCGIYYLTTNTWIHWAYEPTNTQ